MSEETMVEPDVVTVRSPDDGTGGGERAGPEAVDGAAPPGADPPPGEPGGGSGAARPSPVATVWAALRSKAAVLADPRQLARSLLLPLVGIGTFLLVWAVLAPQVDTSLGALPGPGDVWSAGVGLFGEWQSAREAEASFYAVQEARNQQLAAAGLPLQDFPFSAAPTFVDQVWTSLRTVALGFVIATVVAVPVGLLSGLSRSFHAAINPLIQIMKPVSPLAWLPIVTMVISAVITSPDPLLPKSFVISALVVALCSLWPTLINTGVGASSVDGDLLNVGRVLRLGWFAKLTKLVLPSSLPFIFTGMRLSLGVGWMVLIAAEMLSQNPGLGKFVWDEFQNGSSESLARIMFAVVVIGLIGYALDRVMSGLQRVVSRNRVVA